MNTEDTPTPNPDRRIGEEKPMNTKQISEAGKDPIDYPDVPLSVALVNSNLSIQDRLWALQAINDRRDLRAQLAEAARKLHIAQCDVEFYNKKVNEYAGERDAAQTRVGDLEGLLKLALFFGEHSRECCFVRVNAPCDCGLHDAKGRIDAALATSPHRLAGRGDQ